MITVGFQLVSIDPSEAKGLGRDGIGQIPVKDGGSLADAMRIVGLPPDQPFMTLVNGNPVAQDDRAKKALADGDQVVVFPPIEGG
jgi:sulfur carrier protein ThiS